MFVFNKSALMLAVHQSDRVVPDVCSSHACQRQLSWRLRVRTSDVSGVVPGEDGLFTADVSVPLSPAALKLIQKQKLLSNGELQ